EDRARAGQPLELVLASRLEREARALEQLAGRARDEDVAGAGERRDARRRVHGDAADLSAGELDLAGVEADPDADAELGDRGVHFRCRAHRPRRAVEEREEAVAGGVDLAAAEAPDHAADPVVVLLHQMGPGAIAEALDSRGRADDVAEHHGREYAFAEVLGRQAVEVARGELDRVPGLVALHLGVVTRRDVIRVAGRHDELRAVVHPDPQRARDHVADVAELTGAGRGDRLHVARPAPARLEEEAADRDIVQPDDADAAVGERADLVGTLETLALKARHGSTLVPADFDARAD